MSGADETWKHDLLCNSDKNLREECVENLKNKLMSTDKHKHAQDYEKKSVNEMIKDMQLCSRGYDNFYANQQRAGIKNLFKGIVVKELVMIPQKSVKFNPHNRVLIVMCVNLYHDCWKKRCVVLHDPSMQLIGLKNEIERAKEKYLNGSTEELKKYVDVHKIDENSTDSIHMLLWVKSERDFIKRAKKRVKQNIRNLSHTIRRR